MKKTTLYNRAILTLIGFLAFLNFSSAQTITFGSSTVNLLVGAQYTCTGYFNDFAQGEYTLVLTQSGNMNVSGLVIDYNDGVRGMGPYSNGDHIWIVDNNQHYIFTLMYSAPANVPCGAQSTITIALNSNGTNIGTNTSTVNLVNQTATYNSYLCENSTYTYILSQNGNMGSIAANGEYIWSLSTTQTGWEINGHSAPYTLPSSTATYVSIKTPSSGPAGNATLTVNGANMCGTFSETITTDLPEPTFSYVYSSVCVGQAVTWTIKPVPCATSYTWSADNSDVSLSPDGLSCTIAGMKAGFSSVHVVAKNSYTTGSPLAWTIRVIAGNDPIHCNGK